MTEVALSALGDTTLRFLSRAWAGTAFLERLL